MPVQSVANFSAGEGTPSTRPIFGVSAIDLTTEYVGSDGKRRDALTVPESVARSQAKLGAGAYYKYFSSKATPTWDEFCSTIPPNAVLVVSVKKYADDAQWVANNQAFANAVPPRRPAPVVMVFNEEPEPVMSGAEFVRRANLVRHIYENHPTIIPSINLQDYSFNPKSERDWKPYIYSWCRFVGVSTYHTQRIYYNATFVPPDAQIARTEAEMMTLLEESTNAVVGWGSTGCGMLVRRDRDLLSPYSVLRQQRTDIWLPHSAKLLAKAGAELLMWFDIDFTDENPDATGQVKPTGDERILIDIPLHESWKTTYASLSAQAAGVFPPGLAMAWIGRANGGL